MALAALALLLSACGDSGSPLARGLRGRDRSAAAGIAQITRTWSAPVGDVNLDGKPDFILMHHFMAADTIFINEGGRFVEFAPKTLIARDRHNCAIGDVNRDGLADVFCTIGGDQGRGRRNNELMIQQKNHTFVDRASAYGVSDELGRGRYARFVDVNKDGYLDLFVTNQTPRADGTPVPNRLYINERGVRFRDEPDAGLDQAIGNVCLKVVDWDRDGDPDFLNCGNTAVQLFRNENGRFVDIGRQLRLLPVPAGVDQSPRRTTDYHPHWRDALLADFDGDGFLDSVGISFDGVVLQRGGAGGFAAPKKLRSLERGWAVATGDINKDGRPDLYVLQSCLEKKSELPDAMLLNTGSFEFEEVPMAQNTTGCGGGVEPIDYNGDGRTDFIVLNGHNLPKGPVQLIDFAPAS